MVFLHLDEFEKQYGLKMDYTVILKEKSRLEVVVSREQLGSFQSLAHLMEAITKLEASD
ncbi:MAG: hypothetical protein GQ542_14660 [Desulforhopalus sp.]|nr:hypothetical protein [Desulforhopalus sp.]